MSEFTFNMKDTGDLENAQSVQELFQDWVDKIHNSPNPVENKMSGAELVETLRDAGIRVTKEIEMQLQDKVIDLNSISIAP